MAEEKRKPKTADGDDPGVLSSLPSTRPQRLSRRGREDSATTPRKAGPAPAARKPKAKAAQAKPSAAARRKAAAGTKAKATATKAESAAAAARPARRPRTKDEPAPIPLATSGKPRPTPVRAGHPTLEDSAPARPPEPADGGGQSGVDLVKTVLQAAGEVAQIGATVGGQIVKRAVDRLPKKP